MSNLTIATAQAVRSELRHRGISQAAIAPVIGVNQPAISARMRGRVPFSIADLERIAAHLGIDVRDLLPVEATA